jgi:AraC family transcriptional regulator, regulatory protein of adaptative response / DNA-3-methyladenine glycosylase II
MIIDGALDEQTEAQLASTLGVSARHLRRLFALHAGVTPDQLARSRRAHFARRLLDDTDLPVTDIAFASGFGSVRQLNRACQTVFRDSPVGLRAKRRRSDRLVADGGLVLRLAFEGPLEWPTMLSYFARRAIPGVESVTTDAYRRTIVVDGHPGVLELTLPEPDLLLLRAHLPQWRGLLHIVQRARRIFALDAPVQAAYDHLVSDLVIGQLIRRRPGIRVPGTWEPFETGVRAIIGQQISISGANTLTRRLVERLGQPVPGLEPLGLSHTFPTPTALAEGDLAGLGLTQARVGAIRGFASSVASGQVALDRSQPLPALVESLSTIPGMGPWTVQYIALRMGERDAFPNDDLGLRRAVEKLNASPRPPLQKLATEWSPWRATAAAQLWLAHPPCSPEALDFPVA